MPVCPFCGLVVDKKSEDCVKNDIQGLNTRAYYHLKCHKLAQSTKKEEWPYNLSKKDDLNVWAENIYDYFTLQLHLVPNMMKIKSQMKHFNTRGMKYKGMFLTVRFFYEVKQVNGEDKSEGGIGIVPYLYNEAQDYWTNKVKKDTETLEQIEQQILDMKEKKIKKIPYAQKNIKKKKELSFAQALGTEGET